MRDLSQVLHSLGFLESETKTYTAALEHGPGTVIDLTKLTRLSRQATYVAIEALTERGLMASVLRGKKRFYVSEDPEKLLSYAQRKEVEIKDRIDDLRRTLPELKLKVGGDKPIVKLFEGKEGMRTIMADIEMSKPKELYDIVDLSAVQAILSVEDLQPLLAMIKKIGTKVSGFVAGTPRTGTVEAMSTQLPTEMSNFKSEIFIYDNKIALLTFEGKMHSVIIESKALAQTLRILFDLAHKGTDRK